MAEFCLDCMNKLEHTHLTKMDVILDYDICEGCGRYVPCVIDIRTPIERVRWPFWRRRKKDDE